MEAIISLLTLIVFIYIMTAVMKHSFGLIFGNWFTSTSTTNTTNTLSFPFKAIRRMLTSKFNSGFMNSFEANKFLNESHRGLVIDGDTKRLTPKDSFNHLVVMARAGAGKTTGFIIPNIFRLASSNASMVVTDLSGELYEKTSGYLKSKGYKILVLNPENLNESMRYNPLFYATDSLSIDEMADSLIQSSYSGNLKAEDKIWLDGAKQLICILGKTLLNTGNYRYINLANINRLINSYGADGSTLDPFIYKYADTETFDEWKGFVSGNPKTVLSFVSTAKMALTAIAVNDNLKKLTAHHTINFDNLRKEKTIIYIKIPTQKQSQYSFILNIFYLQLFNNLMNSLPTKSDLAIYCLLDEFGNMNIPNFSSIITSIRKYNVSISIILQNINQLKLKYGEYEAKTILDGGISSKIYFSGADYETITMLEHMLGTKIIEEEQNGTVYKKEVPVLSARDIRTMKDNEIIFLYGNKLPLKLQVTPYYEKSSFKSYANYKISSPILARDINDIIDYIDLDIDFENEK
ncbi:MAG: type IV secretory system conjugative DNA transfer family protein [Arcobacteraceae bacterium]|jgi:type IV secretory pathway TraG/TraD family ATPase VirD4|nr:type IV secretory system conjugative DNA transfer family protein [Arcobacteraceae bacterium]